MSGDERHNGWTNRETWAVALHINNDQGWQESVHEALREADAEQLPCGECGYGKGEHEGEDHDFRPSPTAAGDIIRENVEETLNLIWQGAITDGDYFGSPFAIVREDIGSLWRVDWTELGAAFLSDLDES